MDIYKDNSFIILFFLEPGIYIPRTLGLSIPKFQEGICFARADMI